MGRSGGHATGWLTHTPCVRPSHTLICASQHQAQTSSHTRQFWIIVRLVSSSAKAGLGFAPNYGTTCVRHPRDQLGDIQRAPPNSASFKGRILTRSTRHMRPLIYNPNLQGIRQSELNTSLHQRILTT